MRSRVGLWLRRALGAAMTVVLLALLTGAIYQRVSSARALRKYPAPGHLVDVGGYRLHILCSGSGQPTVILEAGGGGSSLDWRHIQVQIATLTRVCAYDRAGVGWSDESPHPVENALQDLEALLQDAPVPGPYVLVGASIGGLFSQLVAYTHPHAVAGLVLIDAAHPDLASRSSAEAKRAEQRLAGLLTTFSYAANFGVTRALDISMVPSTVLGPDERASAAAVDFRPAWYGTTARYLREFATICARVQAAKRPLDIPVVVVSHGKPDQIIPFMSREANAQHERLWGELQQDLVRLSPRGRQIIASRSGHMIAFDQPDIVVAAVTEVVNAERASK